MAERTDGSGSGATGDLPADVSGSRGRVLAALRAAGGPAGIDDLATQLGLHRNTVRFHLEALLTSGLVEEGRRPTGGKGRPKAVFHPTSHGARSGQRNYQLMAAVLIDHLARTAVDPGREAYEAGRAWGRRLALTAKGTPRRRPSVPAVVEMFDAMGFEPKPAPPRRPNRILLHNCPFREVVDEHQDLACAVHAGLIEGMLATDDTLPAAGKAVRLEPFETSATCIVHL